MYLFDSTYSERKEIKCLVYCLKFEMDAWILGDRSHGIVSSVFCEALWVGSVFVGTSN